MRKLTGNQTRQLFLDYFESKGHMIEPGASLVPINDPTLLWINAGVAALKKYFDGTEKPRCNRIANAQKSIRTNDIENVGKTARHHTFFEMLGNFSIGDYFKEDAIKFAWEFLTDEQWIGMDKDKIYVTIYSDDDEAYRIWTEVINFNPERILRTEGNFWQIGEGPSGPDTEIFYDRGINYDPENIGERLFFEELENDRYIEIWNVVFSQYDAKDGVSRKDFKELPQKNIDTGMGLERLVSIIQNGETNYDTDLFLPIINAAVKLSKHPYDNEYKMAYRVIADHIRTVTFALGDGANFSNEGRGYVLRRVLRRAVRFGIKLNINEPFMYQLVDVVIANMSNYYPYLAAKADFIKTLVRREEEIFHKTLNNGEKLLTEAMDNATNKILDGAVVFKLYDTFGFPKELTIEIATESGYEVDIDGFNNAMDQQKQRARNARSSVDSLQSQSSDLLEFNAHFEFVGYSLLANQSNVTGLFINGVAVDSIDKEGDICVSASCFYAESGGQVADTGIITNDKFSGRITDVKKSTNGQHLHHVIVEKGSITKKESVTLEVDQIRRAKIKANHSSVHLLQSALKTVVGDHINQAGSFVSDEYARFDFTHFDKVNNEQLKEIEGLVNSYICSAFNVVSDVMTIDEAKTCGAIALFDEKYGDTVRVVTMGAVSKELCGGTHVDRISDIGLYKIDFEESIGSGIRRIQTRTGLEAYQGYVDYKNTLESIATSLDLKSLAMVEGKIASLIHENADNKKELARLQEANIVSQASQIVNDATAINGIKFIILDYQNFDAKKLKNFAETVRNKADEAFVFVINRDEESLTIVAAASKLAIESGFKAGEIVKEICNMTAGRGGGRDDIAQGGTKELQHYEVIMNYISNKIQR